MKALILLMAVVLVGCYPLLQSGSEQRPLARMRKEVQAHQAAIRQAAAENKGLPRLWGVMCLQYDGTFRAIDATRGPYHKLTQANLDMVTYLSVGPGSIGVAKTWPSLTDEDLEFLTRCRNLHTLDMHQRTSNVTDAGFKELAKLQSLMSINLGFSEITDEGLKELAKLKKLRTLSLHKCERLTDEGIKGLVKCEQLWKLILTHTNITEKGLSELVKSKSLIELDLSNSRASWCHDIMVKAGFTHKPPSAFYIRYKPHETPLLPQ